MSQTYPDLSLTNFPDNLDSFPNLQDISASDVQLLTLYKNYIDAGNVSASIQLLNDNPTLKNKIFSATNLNRITQGLLGVERFFKDNVDGYIDTKQIEFQAEIDKFDLKGTYNPITQYYKWNMANYNGNIYMAKQDNIGHTPITDGSIDDYWILFSRKGDTGATGLAGANGLNLVYLQIYNSETHYVIGNAVSFNNSIYYCINPTTGGIDPTNSGYWSLFLSNSAIPISVSAPLNPSANQLWINSTTGIISYWNTISSSWIGLTVGAITDGTYTFTASDINNLSNEITILSEKVSPETPLNTASQDLSGAVNEINSKAGKIGTKEVDETDITDNYTIRYDVTKDKVVWVRSEIDRIPPSPITSFVANAKNTQVDLSWVNPTDVDFMQVKILRKTDSYPTSITDGTVIYVGGATSFSDTGLTNGTTYYYRAFTMDTSNNVNSDITMEVNCIPVAYLKYGVAIDLTNSNPSTSVTYTDDAIGFTGGDSAWDNRFPFNIIKSCVLNNPSGTVNYYLNPNDFTKKVDGTASDITSGSAGDVMIEIPKMAYSIVTNGNVIYVKVTDNPSPTNDTNENWHFYAHTRTTEGDKNNLYIGAYLGYNLSSKLRSLSGKSPTANQAIGTFRTQAQANGSGYDLLSFYPLTLLQCLYLIRYKNLDSQTALGRGYVDGNSAAIATGGTNTKGMFYGETTGKLQMKFCGIEDFWGNCYYWIDGLFSDASRNMLTAFKSFNDAGSGYTNYGQGATSDISGYMSKPQGTSDTGFIVKEVSGSATTYFSDYAYLSASLLPIFGGSWSSASYAGAFYLRVAYAASSSNSYFAARLMFL